MRPKQHKTTDEGDLFRARLDQIINLKHELVQLAGKIDWSWIDHEIAPLYSQRVRLWRFFRLSSPPLTLFCSSGDIPSCCVWGQF
jgi:hypothetical protein